MEFPCLLSLVWHRPGSGVCTLGPWWFKPIKFINTSPRLCSEQWWVSDFAPYFSSQHIACDYASPVAAKISQVQAKTLHTICMQKTYIHISHLHHIMEWLYKKVAAMKTYEREDVWSCVWWSRWCYRAPSHTPCICLSNRKDKWLKTDISPQIAQTASVSNSVSSSTPRPAQK